jgi:hypothetical protein
MSERTIEIFFDGIERNRRLLPWSLQDVVRDLGSHSAGH